MKILKPGLLLLLITFSGMQGKSQMPSRLWVGLQGGGGISLSNFSPALNPADNEIVDSLRAYSTLLGSGTAGVSVLYYLKDYVMLDAGLMYSVLGYRLKSDWTSGPNPAGNSVIGAAEEKYFHWVGIPINATLFLLKPESSVRPFFSAGFAPEFHIRETLLREFLYDNGTRERNHLNTPWGPFHLRFSAKIGAGVFCKLFYRWQMKIEPSLNFLPHKRSGETWGTLFMNPSLQIGFFKGI